MDDAMTSAVPSRGAEAAAEACHNQRVGRENAAALHVRDAMVAAPKTVSADATVRDLRTMFSNPHVRTALIVDGTRFVGVVQRAQVQDVISDEHPARELAVRDVPTVEPDTPLTDALTMLDSRDERRLVVLDADGDRLRGLLCLTSDRRGFCQS
jgi:predicted transcriptional regulator